ncbi:M48 family metallopeptidase [Pseudalkalibacillus caeni]|uniref:M48 family metallopeptidase n=1 Tax=Exobacillus caeni TaxID=2574798 RepID=UPI001FE860FE|nr:M48 family metallopeptidase [Pseudalkalibacillus caeni]
MKKRFSIWFGVLFVIYTLLIGWYLFFGANTELPNVYKGTSADPATFMNARQLELSHEFSRIKSLIYFVSIPLEWGIYLFVLYFGLSRVFRNWSKGISRFSFVQIAIYVILLMCINLILTFPLDYINYQVSQAYEISTQSFSSWMKDLFISFWVSNLFMILTVFVIYFFMNRKPKKWWLYAWLLSVPFTVFMMFIQPVVIDPLYNDFYRLEDKQLEEKILSMASRADIPAERVFEVDMSEKTNALNAYVTGIGSNLRIVLWDTTLNTLEDDEILFVMAHEMGHFVMHHLYFNLFASIFLSLIGLYIGAKLLKWAVARYGEKWGVSGINDIASLPVLLLIFSLLSFLVGPIENAVSRSAENDSDVYAIEMTEDPEAAIGAFQELTINGLSEVNPPGLVKFFRYGHPTMLERIHLLESYMPKEKEKMKAPSN